MSKVIRKNSGEEIQRWELPNVENIQDLLGGNSRMLTASPLTAKQIDKIQQDAYQEAYNEGFAKGVKDGKQAAGEQLEQQIASMNMLLNHCAKPLQQLDQEVEEQLIKLVVALTRQLVRREIKSDPGQIVAVVREALHVLPVNMRDTQILLHPDDIQIITQVLSNGDKTTYWRLIPDATLGRGDCRIQTETSSIDATIERRLNSVIAKMLGGEREQDAPQVYPSADDAHSL